MSSTPGNPFGVSIIICCHNSAARLEPTLGYISAQRTSAGLPWEVIVVDNASTDGTAERARQLWNHPSASLHIVKEPEPGLTRARWRGVAAAQFEIISFIDDDNWLGEDWVQGMADLMSTHPEVGAANGWSVCGIPNVPKWFEKRFGMYAISRPGDASGDVTDQVLWGAGLTTRKSIMENLLKAGFVSAVGGRKGGQLLQGDDTELCWAFRAAGWRFWREKNLRLVHAIEPRRADWTYTRRLNRGCGAGSVAIEAFHLGLMDEPSGWAGRARQTWIAYAIYALQHLLGDAFSYAAALHKNVEGDSRVLEYEHLMGRLRHLLSWRRGFDRRVREIRSIQRSLREIAGPDASVLMEPAPQRVPHQSGQISN